MIAQRVVNEIKSTLNGFDENKMYEHMYHHYKLMRLVDDKGKWATPELQKLSHQLLPRDITVAKSKKFDDEMAHIAENNPYLANFLQQAQKKNSQF